MGMGLWRGGGGACATCTGACTAPCAGAIDMTHIAGAAMMVELTDADELMDTDAAAARPDSATIRPATRVKGGACARVMCSSLTAKKPAYPPGFVE